MFFNVSSYGFQSNLKYSFDDFGLMHVQNYYKRASLCKDSRTVNVRYRLLAFLCVLSLIDVWAYTDCLTNTCMMHIFDFREGIYQFPINKQFSRLSLSSAYCLVVSLIDIQPLEFTVEQSTVQKQWQFVLQFQ